MTVSNKVRNPSFSVIRTKAGTQYFFMVMDSGFRPSDDDWDLLRI